MQADGTTDELLEWGIQALKEDNRPEAREHLERLVELDEESEQGWYYLSWAVESEKDRQRCLEHVLVINSTNLQARRLLDQSRTNQLEKEIKSLSKEQSRLSNIIQNRSQQLSTLQTTHTQLRDRISELEVRSRQEEQKLRALKPQRESLQALVEARASEAAELESAIEAMKISLSAAEVKLAARERIVDERQLQLRRSEERLREIETRVVERQRSLVEFEIRLGQLGEELRHKETSAGRLEAEIRDSANTLRALEGRAAAAAEERRRLLSETRSSEEELSRSRRTLDGLLETLPRLRHSVAGIEAHRLSQAKALEEVTRLLEGLCAEQRSLEAEIRERRSVLVTLSMGEEPAGLPSELTDVEDYLRPQVTRARLLAEIPISIKECDALGTMLSLRLTDLERAEALRVLRSECPRTFSAFLVAFAEHYYCGGDFWGMVIPILGLKRAYAWRVGQVFEKLLEEFDLAPFYDVRAEPERYASLILAHGIMPNHCLPGYFATLLHPSLSDDSLSFSTPRETIDEWLCLIQKKRVSVCPPASLFLAYGGHIAEDFVSRCRAMASEYLSTGLLVSPNDVGLPARIVSVYRDWAAQAESTLRPTNAHIGARLSRPEVWVEPEGRGLGLDLPEQRIPPTLAGAEVRWIIEVDGEAFALPVHVHRVGPHWKTEQTSVPLRQPASEWRVSFVVDDREIHTWTLQGFLEDRPLLIVDPRRRSMVPWHNSPAAQRQGLLSLPSRTYVLIYPDGYRLETEGSVQSSESGPLPWDWTGYRVETSIPASGSRLSLVRGERPVLSVSFRDDEESLRPRLIGGSIISANHIAASAPVYVGAPPDIRVPLSARLEQEEELRLWRLKLHNNGPSSQETDFTGSLLDLEGQLAVGQGFVDIPLSLPSLLGNRPFGDFELTLRGPLGHDAELSLRIIPYLSVQVLEPPQAAAGTSPPPTRLAIRLSPGEGLDCYSRGHSCTVVDRTWLEDGWEHTIQVDPGVTDLEIVVSGSLPSGGQVSVPVPLTLRRAAWALADGDSKLRALTWNTEAKTGTTEKFLRDPARYLMLSLPPGERTESRPRLQLVDHNGNEIESLDTSGDSGHPAVSRVDLSPIVKAISTSQSPLIRLQFQRRGLPGRDQGRPWPVLSLVREAIASDIQVAASTQANATKVSVAWHEHVPTHHRFLRFWSVWQPWQEVKCVAIPEDAAGEVSLELPDSEVPPGRYVVDLIVVDPVSGCRPEMQGRRNNTSSQLVDLIAPHEREVVLTEALSAGQPSFSAHLERAHIRQGLGNGEGASEDVDTCVALLEDASPLEVLALVELIRSYPHEEQTETLGTRMGAPPLASTVLQAYESGQLEESALRAYLELMPRPRSLCAETLEELVLSPHEPWHTLALSEMIGRSLPKGPEVLLEEFTTGRISETVAVSLLTVNAGFAADYLKERVAAPAAYHLLVLLSRQMDEPPLLRPGMWLFCDAGWGRVDRIDDAQGDATDWVFAESQHAVVHATLRPNLDHEPVAVDLASRTVTFTQAQFIFTCTKCRQFSARDWDIIAARHDPVAHTDGHARYLSERGNVLPLTTIRFSPRPPQRFGLGLWQSPPDDSVGIE
jgi:hypothetical protein